ncbi:hypothetical protein STSP_47820 [Streptomyces jeddahensis]|uniref:Uncharacterized protein n=1 Tax=Streptomyces jeddahensis TaxID=1716141 RepID=A0A177HLL8_9ACTN|nr:hypothetical protein STSP_47820 [Streptomyces jeddahensis]
MKWRCGSTPSAYLHSSGRHRRQPRFYRPIHRTPLIVRFGPADGRAQTCVLDVSLGE